jgi:hypothetical protein
MTTERKIIHDIRNCHNSLILNSAYLALFCRSDALESLDAIIKSAETLYTLTRQLDFLREGIDTPDRDLPPTPPADPDSKPDPAIL